MTRKTLMAGAAALALILAGGAYAAAESGHDKDWHGHHGDWAGAGGPDAMADHLMKEFDLNKDGKITKDEIGQAMKDHLNTHFAEIDANHDGFISEEEMLQAHMARMKEHMDEKFKHLDKNGDGKISSDEFAAALPMLMHHRMDHMGMWGHHDGPMHGDMDMPGPGGKQP